MREIVSILLLIVGAAFMFLGSLGVVRMPDLYNRMQSATKSTTLGVASVMLAAAIYFSHDLGLVTRALAVIFFAFLTAPVGAQMIARAAHFTHVHAWNLTVNELEGQYDPVTHELRSPPTQAAGPGSVKEA